MRWIEKNDWHLFNGLDVLYHHAKFGEDRTMRAGCRCENVVFVTIFFCPSRPESGALFVRGAHNYTVAGNACNFVCSSTIFDFFPFYCFAVFIHCMIIVLAVFLLRPLKNRLID